MKLISITGPESTGKSTLARELAEHYHSSWVEEYAREYLDGSAGEYQFEDICNIARGQYIKELEAARGPGEFLFCDTDLLVCKIWSEFKYGTADPWINRMVAEHRYDLYLLCDIDLPWVDDPLREHPDRRKELFDLYFYYLEKLNVPFQVISGNGKERKEQAISIIEKTFKEGNPDEEKRR